MKFHTMKLAKMLFASAAVLACAGLPAAAGVLDLDFTSDGSGNAGAFGGGPPVGTAPFYTAFVVAELGPAAMTTANPSITENGATFTINGNISAWPGNAGVTDQLQGDYLFIPVTSGGLGVTPVPMPWTVSGLVPSTQYKFTFLHGTNSPGRTTLIESAGADPLTIGAAVAIQTGQMTLTSSAAGVITGTFAGGVGEGNLAAMSVNRVFAPGDANGDGAVNGADFDVISQNLFTGQRRGANGDLNLDNMVDFADFRIWKNATSSSTGSSEGVPEPASLTLVAVSLLAAGVVRRRRVA